MKEEVNDIKNLIIWGEQLAADVGGDAAGVVGVKDI